MLNFTVGPVMSAKEVLQIGSESSPYFRTKEFSEIMKQNERYFLSLINAPEDSRCVFLTSSGTGAMESAVMNVLNNKDKAIVVNGGTFGQRFVDLCNIHHIEYSEIQLDFGKNVKEKHLEVFENKGYTAFLVNMDETSSGTLYDMKLISDFCKRNNLLLIVDAISAFLSDQLDMSELEADVVITGSQKALAVPPGISILALSERSLKRIEENEEKCLYLSLKEALKNGERGQTPFTPAVTTLLQINKRLSMIIESGGVEKERERITKRAEYVRSRIEQLPFDYVSESMSNAVTALRSSRGNAKEIIRVLQDEYGIWVCPNGGIYADSIFRIGHIGDISDEDNRRLVDALYELKERDLL